MNDGALSETYAFDKGEDPGEGDPAPERSIVLWRDRLALYHVSLYAAIEDMKCSQSCPSQLRHLGRPAAC